MTIVESLLGHNQVDLALECLGSLRRCSQEPVRLRLRDDGTLTESDRERLVALGSPEIVDRRTADAQVEPLLSAHPASLEYRRRNPLGLKLFDIALGQPGRVHFCDTDVLFLRPVEGLFAVVPDDQGVFLRDVQNAYSLRSWQLLRHRMRLPQRINTGLFAFPRERFDLDLVEWYLSRPEMAFAPMWQEQTAWALLAGSLAASWYEPAHFRLATGTAPAGGPATALPCALHFVAPTRRFLGSWRSQPASQPALLSPIRALAIRARPLSAGSLAMTELNRMQRRNKS